MSVQEVQRLNKVSLLWWCLKVSTRALTSGPVWLRHLTGVVQTNFWRGYSVHGVDQSVRIIMFEPVMFEPVLRINLKAHSYKTYTPNPPKKNPQKLTTLKNFNKGIVWMRNCGTQLNGTFIWCSKYESRYNHLLCKSLINRMHYSHFFLLPIFSTNRFLQLKDR